MDIFTMLHHIRKNNKKINKKKKRRISCFRKIFIYFKWEIKIFQIYWLIWFTEFCLQNVCACIFEGLQHKMYCQEKSREDWGEASWCPTFSSWGDLCSRHWALLSGGSNRTQRNSMELWQGCVLGKGFWLVVRHLERLPRAMGIAPSLLLE